MLSDKVSVATVPKYGSYSRTLVATAPIAEGEAVWWYQPGAGEEEETFTWAQIAGEPDPARREALMTYSYMIGVDEYASTADPDSDPSWFFNHSCEGNCWYEGDHKVVARRAIAPGEELTYDYAFTETEASFHASMQCRCGAAACRGALRFDDYRRPSFWASYKGRTTAHIASRGAECGWLNGRLAVRRAALPRSTTTDQRGVFALQPVEKGVLLAVFGGKTIGAEEAAALDAAVPGGYPYLLQVDAALWQVPHRRDIPDAPDFINHSCAANAGMADSTQVVALRDIAAGEEITLDYAMINDGASQWAGDNFECACGAAGCRRRVTADDWARRDLQERFWPWFAPFVKRKIVEMRPDLAAATEEGVAQRVGAAAAVLRELEVVEQEQRDAAAYAAAAVAAVQRPRSGKSASAAGTPTAVCISVKAG